MPVGPASKVGPAGQGASMVPAASQEKASAPCVNSSLGRNSSGQRVEAHRRGMVLDGAGGRDWFTFSGVNYVVDFEELGRDLKI